MGERKAKYDADAAGEINIIRNLNSDHIYITEANLRLCLKEYLEIVTRQKDWIAPLSVLVSIIIALVTTDFQQASFGIAAPVWHAIFIVAATICLVLAIVQGIKALLNRKVATEEHLVKKIRGEDG